MSQDIARYIEIVGKDNLKRHLKENLKAELHRAIAEDNWQLALEINAKIEETENKIKTIKNQLEVDVWQRLSKIRAEQLEIEEEQVKPENIIEKYDYGFLGYPGE